MSITPGEDSTSALRGRERLLSERRLKLTLILFMGGAVLGLSVLFFVLVHGIFARLTPSLEDDLRWIAQRGALELAKSAEVGILTADRDAVSRAFGDYREHDDVVALIAADGGRAPLVTYGQIPAEIGNPFTGTPRAVRSVGDYLVAWDVCDIEGTDVGAVAVILSQQRLRAGDELRHTFLAVAMIGGALALLASLVFIALYVGPVVRLTERAFDELSDKTEEAMESARVKGEFLNNISHELRTPMSGVIGMLDLLSRAELPDEEARNSRLALHSAEELLSLINEILDSVDMQRGEATLHVEAVDLRSLVAGVVEELSNAGARKGLRVIGEVADELPERVCCDRVRLRKVLLELGGNALEFSESGQVVVRVDIETGESPSGPMTPGANIVHARFAVSDTGPGVPADQLDRIFRPFTQADGSLTRAHGGAGLGLAVTRQRVEIMGGQLDVDSEPGVGSTFAFTLPLVVVGQDDIQDDSRNDAVPRTPPAAPPDDSAPVLVVEDNPINQQVMTKMLESAGYQVRLAQDGREALDLTAEQRFALAFMDCQMPTMDGYTATRLIREREATTDGAYRLPIVACTAHAHRGERERALAAGMDDFLAKPVRREQLVDALTRWTSELRGRKPGERMG